MAVRKNPEDRIGRHKQVYDDLFMVWDGVARGPNLPQNPVRNWHPQTILWWEMVRHSAQAMSFHESDWFYLQDAALLHHLAWAKKKVVVTDDDGNKKIEWVDAPNANSLLAEFRIRTERYGFSWPDRRKYGYNILTPDEVAQAAEQETRRSAAVDYKKRLTEK